MRTIWRNVTRWRAALRQLVLVAAALFLAAPAFAQGGRFTLGKRGQRPPASLYEHDSRGLSLVAIVVAGLTFAFGEGGSKRILAGVLFGVGMAIAAVNFLSWLFPGG